MPLQLYLAHVGQGVFKAISALDMQLAEERCPVNRAQIHNIKEDRSNKQNRWFFGLIGKAFENQESERWNNPEHLRAFALCRVGHRDTIPFEFPEQVEPLQLQMLADFAEALIARVRAQGKYAFVRTIHNGIAVDIPKSWAFDKLEHPEATRLAQEVADWLCTEVCPGMTPKELFREVEKEAA